MGSEKLLVEEKSNVIYIFMTVLVYIRTTCGDVHVYTFVCVFGGALIMRYNMCVRFEYTCFIVNRGPRETCCS